MKIIPRREPAYPEVVLERRGALLVADKSERKGFDARYLNSAGARWGSKSAVVAQ